MNAYKKWGIGVVTGILVSLLVFAGSIAIVDPFAQYHLPWFSMLPIFSRDTQAYVNPGMAKNYDYDSVLIGSSVSENFSASMVDKLFDCHTVKLPFAGGSSKNYEMILDVALQKHTLKNVFYSVDMFGLTSDPDTPRNNPVPEYLYNTNIFDDVSYLLNKAVFFHYAGDMVKQNIQGDIVSYNKAYNWENEHSFSQERVLKQYNRPAQSNTQTAANSFFANIDRSIENLSRIIKNNPNTTFYVFYPPYSVIQYDSYLREGSFDALCNGYKHSMEKWLSFENVEVYSFINIEHIITNLDLYREMMHFSEAVNAYMVMNMADGNFRITKENCANEISAFRKFILDYDFSEYFGTES